MARSTASRAIKSNLTTTEIMAEPDISTNQRRTNVILQRHAVHKTTEKALYPGELAGADTGGDYIMLATAQWKLNSTNAKCKVYCERERQPNVLHKTFQGIL